MLPTFSGATTPDNAPFWFGSAADYHKFTNKVSNALFFFTILRYGQRNTTTQQARHHVF